AVALAGCGKKAAETKDETSPPAPVEAVQAEEKVLGQWTELIGTPQPLPGRSARITAAVEGRGLWVLDDGNGTALEEGKTIEKGQVIVQLDDRVAKSNVEKVRANLNDLIEQRRQADYALEVARLTLESNEALRNGKADKDLPLVSRIDFDKARLAFKDAQAKQQAAQEKVEGTQAELKGLETQLGFYKLRAPIAGRLGLWEVVLGQTLAIGAPVAEIIDLKEADVLCFVPPYTAGQLSADPPQPARLAGEDTTSSRNDESGKVIFIAPQAQAETGNFAVKVRF